MLAAALALGPLHVAHLAAAWGGDPASRAASALGALCAVGLAARPRRTLRGLPALAMALLALALPLLAPWSGAWVAHLRPVPAAALLIVGAAALLSWPLARLVAPALVARAIPARTWGGSLLVALGASAVALATFGGTASLALLVALALLTARLPRRAPPHDEAAGVPWARDLGLGAVVGWLLASWCGEVHEVLPPDPRTPWLLVATGAALFALGALAAHVLRDPDRRWLATLTSIALPLLAALVGERVAGWRTVAGWEATFAGWVAALSGDAAALAVAYPVLVAALALGPFLLCLGARLEQERRGDARRGFAGLLGAVGALFGHASVPEGALPTGTVSAWIAALALVAFPAARALVRRDVAAACVALLALWIARPGVRTPEFHPLALDARDVLERARRGTPYRGDRADAWRDPAGRVRVRSGCVELTPDEAEVELDRTTLAVALGIAGAPRSVLLVGPPTDERLELLARAGVTRCVVAELLRGTARAGGSLLRPTPMVLEFVEVPEASPVRFDLVYVAPHPLASPDVAGRLHRAWFHALSLRVADGGALVMACDPTRGTRAALDDLAAAVPDACLYTLFDFWIEPGGDHVPADRPVRWIGPWCLFAAREGPPDAVSTSATLARLAPAFPAGLPLGSPADLDALRIDGPRPARTASMGPLPRHAFGFGTPRRLDPSQGVDALRWMRERAHAEPGATPAQRAFLEGLEAHVRHALPTFLPQAFRFAPDELEAYERAAESAGPRDRAWLLRAFTRLAPILRAKRPDRAWRDLERIALLDPTHAGLAREIVRAHLELLAVERARPWLAVLPADERRALGDELLEVLLRRVGDAATAEERTLLRTLDAEHDGSSRDSWQTVRVARALGERERARETLDAWLRTSPTLAVERAPHVLDVALDLGLLVPVLPWAAEVLERPELSDHTRLRLAERTLDAVRSRLATAGDPTAIRRALQDLARRALEALVPTALEDPPRAERLVEHWLALGDRARALAFVQQQRLHLPTPTPVEDPALTTRRATLDRLLERLDR